MAIAQDSADDANGAYSGGAVVVPGAASDGGGLLRLYYTGNVKEPGEHDFVYEGRGANEILVESEDGMTMGPKRTLLRNADYPEWCSCHVRDPKIWVEEGAYHMLLGARTMDDCGKMLVYRSDDGRVVARGRRREQGPLRVHVRMPRPHRPRRARVRLALPPRRGR